MDIKERLSELREQMKKKGISAYIIPSSDPHQSEYVAEHFKCRQWISGFTGSAGTVVVAKDKAGLWTDGRYFIQAAKQIEGTGIELFKSGQPGVPTYIEWLESNLNNEEVIGLDGKVVSLDLYDSINKGCKSNPIEYRYDLIGEIWEDRPLISKNKVFEHAVSYCGKSRIEKLEIVREEMRKKKAEYHVLSSLDDIAWLFNIRGNDVPNNPVVISYALIGLDKAFVFIDEDKLTEDIIKEFKKDNIEFKSYNNIDELPNYINSGANILLDGEKTNVYVYKLLENFNVIKDMNISTMLKAVKNPVEINSIKACHIKDGVAMAKFMYWLKNSVKEELITEISASDKLENFRRQQEGFIGTSFDTIAGYKEHGAMMHYKATPESDYELEAKGLFLIDSGGQYYDGTTDITRTMALGELTEEEKVDFTLVLKGHIALSSTIFLYGTPGSNLDVLARKPLWDRMIDYKCGTGHGVGFLLNVHEGPHRISTVPSNVKLEPGMIVTNEPGIYREGKHGIRIENILLVTEKAESEFGKFLAFETISYCPIDLDAIKVEMLTEQEREWLNNYHSEVYDKLSAYLDKAEKEWLKLYTRAI